MIAQVSLMVPLFVLMCSFALAAVVPLDTPAMAVKVQAGEYTVRGQTVRVAETVELRVAPPERVEVKGEQQVLVDEPARLYAGGTVLSKTLGPVDVGTRYPKVIDPASVRVYSCEDASKVYREGADYTLDHDWGGLSRVETGSAPKDTKLCFDYATFLQRVDLVQVSRAGKVSIKQGRSAVANPEIPEPDSGTTALATIWVPFRTTAITSDNIFPMPAEDITWRSFIRVSGRERLSNTLRLLKEKKPITIVCWGDSVTCGGSSSTPERCYVERFRSELKKAYPDTPITLINAGIGGSNTESRRDGFEKEVLSHNPDLITVEFVNDVGLGPEKVKANWAEFAAKARAKNPKVEFVAITPHYVMRDWMGSFDASVGAMRQAAKDNGMALADTANIWANLARVGIPYETLEANGINHPNDLGHEFFTACLMELMKAK